MYLAASIYILGIKAILLRYHKCVCVLHLGDVPCVTYQVKALMALSAMQYALWQLFLHKLLTLVKTEFALTPSLIYWRCTSFPDT